MKGIILKAPATIANFGPGFDIFALALKQPFDIIKIHTTPSLKVKIKIFGQNEPIPSEPEKNSAGVAALHYLKTTGRRAGLNIEIHKNINSRAGLGTSGASAAACVYGLNMLFSDHMDAAGLVEIARQGEIASGSTAHADNAAACLLGGFVLIKNDSPLEIVKINAPAIPLVLCVMKKKHLTTRGNIPAEFSLAKLTGQMSCGAALIHGMMTGDLEEIGEAVNTDYVSEPVRAQDIPGYSGLKKSILDAGAFGCNISGGGSSVFAVCEKQSRDDIEKIMSDHIQKYSIHGDVIQTFSSNNGIKETHGL